MAVEDVKTKFGVLRSFETLEAFNSLKKRGRFDPLKETKYRASELKVSRRVLSHWRDANLLDIYGDNPDQIKVSYIGLLWLQVAVELRRFGMSLNTISDIKDHFFRGKRDPIFEGYLFSSFARKDLDIYIIVSVDGRADIGTRNEIETSEFLGIIEENYIRLNLKILKNRLTPNKEKIVNPDLWKEWVADNEKDILSLIRRGEYKEIVLRFKDGSVSHITKKSLIENPNPIGELKKLINSTDGFCDISIKKVNGKFVSMESAIMLKT